MTKLLSITACFAISATVALATPAANAFFVTVKAPPRATTNDFAKRTFALTVTCKEACKVFTKAFIRASAAKRLGFKNVKGKLLIASGSAKFDGKTPAKVSLVLTREAKKRLPTAKRVLRVFGFVQAFPNVRPAVNYSVGWASLLT